MCAENVFIFVFVYRSVVPGVGQLVVADGVEQRGLAVVPYMQGEEADAVATGMVEGVEAQQEIRLPPIGKAVVCDAHAVPIKRQAVFHNSVISHRCVVCSIAEQQCAPQVGTVALVVSGLCYCGVEQGVTAVRTKICADRVVHHTGVVDMDLLRGCVGAIPVAYRGDEPDGVLSGFDVECHAVVGRNAVAVDEPQYSLARVGGRLLFGRIAAYNAGVVQFDFCRAVVVCLLPGERCRRIAFSSQSDEVERARGSCRGAYELQGAVVFAGLSDVQRTLGRECCVGRVDIEPPVGEALGRIECVFNGFATVGRIDNLFAAVEYDVCVAEMLLPRAVVGRQLDEDALSVQRSEVDAYRCPVFPQHVCRRKDAVVVYRVPSQILVGDERGRIAAAVDGVAVFVEDLEGEHRLFGYGMRWVFENGGIFQQQHAADVGVHHVFVGYAFGFTARAPVAKPHRRGVALGYRA